MKSRKKLLMQTTTTTKNPAHNSIPQMTARLSTWPRRASESIKLNDEAPGQEGRPAESEQVRTLVRTPIRRCSPGSS